MMSAVARERASQQLHKAFCAFVLIFLIAPILVVVPLSFNAEPYFTFTEGMLRLDADAYSLRWYASVAGDEEWLRALVNSMVIGVSATVVATVLGTVAALGLASPSMPGRPLVMGLLISPMVTPVIISAAGFFFFYSSLGLAQTHIGLIAEGHHPGDVQAPALHGEVHRDVAALAQQGHTALVASQAVNVGPEGRASDRRQRAVAVGADQRHTSRGLH